MNTATQAHLLKNFNLFINKPLSSLEAKEDFGRLLQYQEAIEILAKRRVPQEVIEQAEGATEIRLELTTWKPQPRIAIFINR